MTECRNNLRPTYDPRQADVWSLGLVLLNLLYHRNPWADPSLDDPDFAEYVRDPRGFLQERFEGIGEEVAGFLADRVFCDVLEADEDGDPVRRVSAGEFGKWAGRLVTMMADSKRRSQPSSNVATSIETLTFTSNKSNVSPKRSAPQASLLSQLAPPVSNGTSETIEPPRLPKVDEVVEGGFSAESAASSLSKSPQDMFPCDEDYEDLPSPSFPPTSTPFFQPLVPVSTSSTPIVIQPSLGTAPARSEAEAEAEATKTKDSDDEDDLKCYAPSDASSRAKRRKRGARRGRSNRTDTSTTSPASPSVLPTVDEQRDLVLNDLALASQELAREISKAKPVSRRVAAGGARPVQERSSSTPASPVQPRPPLAKPALTSASTSGKTGGGMLSRMRNLVKDGNPDLQAFKARVEERNVSLGVTSAPAKMQNKSTTDSRGSIGTSSWGSWTGSTDGQNDSERGRSHWSSTTSRRERLDKHGKSLSRPQQAGHSASFDASPPPSMRLGGSSSASFDSRSSLVTTPMSSFSSVASSTLPPKPPLPSEGSWRRSSPPHYPMLDSATPKPKMKDAIVDATAPDAEQDVNASHITIRPPTSPALEPLPTTGKARPQSSSSNKTATSEDPPQVKTKLAKMLNSISMFNRSQERAPASPVPSTLSDRS